jgi:hypothetical protein
MGVQYEFFGHFTVDPPASTELIDEVNESQGRGYIHEGDFYPWEIDDEGRCIGVGDAEIRNVWDCDEKLAILVAQLTKRGHMISGEIFGETSDGGDEPWKYTAVPGGVTLLHRSEIVYGEGEPIKIGDGA